MAHFITSEIRKLHGVSLSVKAGTSVVEILPTSTEEGKNRASCVAASCYAPCTSRALGMNGSCPASRVAGGEIREVPRAGRCKFRDGVGKSTLPLFDADVRGQQVLASGKRSSATLELWPSVDRGVGLRVR